jgi:hypothetical protein
MGGISGHAGVFSTIEDLSNLARNLLTSYSMQEKEKKEKEEEEGVNLLLNSTTIHLFAKQYNTSQSSRALGWDTNSYDVWNLYNLHFLLYIDIINTTNIK